MSSEIKVSSVKAKDGTAGISIADSTGNVSLSGSLSAGTIGTGVTINAGSNVSGIGQLVGIGVGASGQGTDTNEVTIDVNKNYAIWLYCWNSGSAYSHMETFIAVGNGTSHTFTEKVAMNGAMGVGVGGSGNGTCQGFTDAPFAYAQMFVFEQGTGFDGS